MARKRASPPHSSETAAGDGHALFSKYCNVNYEQGLVIYVMHAWIVARFVRVHRLFVHGLGMAPS